MPIQSISHSRQLLQGKPLAASVRNKIRDVAIWGLSHFARIDLSSGWIRFPFYHHILDDERLGLTRQLEYMGSLGEFISLDDAVSLVSTGGPIKGRFFCVTFDDGFKSCWDNAMPILEEMNVPAGFYVVSDFVNSVVAPGSKTAIETFGYKGRDGALEFLTWENLRAMIAAGMTIGSHTCSHIMLKNVGRDRVISEMHKSKQELELKLGREVRHFSAPYGIAWEHFDPQTDAEIAQRCGYKSFVVANRGAMRQGGDPFFITRDHLMASWSLYQLKYFFSKG